MVDSQLAPVVLEDVSHAFGEGPRRRTVLAGINAHIAPGEIVLLTGPSGSGKTTLLTLVGALRELQSGRARVLGVELAEADAATRVELRRAVGFVFQRHNLVESLSAAENVEIALELRTRLSPWERRRRALAALELVGLGGFEDQRPRYLSGGQRQRVGIARALAPGPRLILADEPTASLDGEAGRAVADLLDRLARDQGVPVLLVTHDDRILDVADRVLHLEDGRLVSDSTAVVSRTESLLASLTQGHRRGELVARIEDLPRDELADLLEEFTEGARRVQELARLADSEAFGAMLDEMLVAVTTRLGHDLRADRVTLFLVDDPSGDLWSKYAEGAEGLEIRLAAGTGLAGAAAGGELVNVADAGVDPRFDRTTDERTGYRTGPVLGAPVRDDEGRVVAVVQAIRPRSAEAFDGEDEAALAAATSTLARVLERWEVMTRRRRR